MRIDLKRVCHMKLADHANRRSNVELIKRKAGSPALAIWALTLKDVAPVRSVFIAAVATCKNVDLLHVVGSREARVSNDSLVIRILEADFRGAS